jgi:uncharacterized RDD family membrane protein YckC
MVQIPPGWYPDPTADAQGVGRQRYWDGIRWTEHVYLPGYSTPAGPVGSGVSGYRRIKTTPDGQPVASWWARVGASLLDFLILLPVSVLVATPVIASQWDALERYFRDSMRAIETGAPPPPDPALLEPLSAPALMLAAGGLLVSAAYTLGFWRWKQATPGKLIVGLRIRRRAEPGPMPWSTMFVRYAVISVLALGGGGQGPLSWVLSVLLLLNYLWPLWDDKNQALHDKAARTNVVIQRR